MKKVYWILYAAAVCMTALGLIFRDLFHTLDVVLAILGIVLFLGTFMHFSYRNARKCPHCGAVYHSGLAALQKKDGMIRCYKCDMIIRLDPEK